MSFKKAALLTGFLSILVSSNPVFGKVVNSENQNDVTASQPQNETVSVLNIEDLNKTQYLNQNFRTGNYNYGYDVKPEGPNGQFHHENKAPDEIVYGCYGYVDPNNKPQITYYVSDSWGYRPVPVGHSMKLFYPSEHPEGATEMKGHQKEWSQLNFPRQCMNLENENGGILSNSGTTGVNTEFLPSPGFIRTPQPPNIPISLVNRQTYSNRDIGRPGAFGKPGGPGTLTEGGFGGEGGLGGLVSGAGIANGGPGGQGGNGGTSSGSSKADGGNGGVGGSAGSASEGSVSDGGKGGHGGDGGEASGASNASGGHGGTGGSGGSATGSSKAVGGDAGSGGKGGVSSGTSTSFGGNGGDGGGGGSASASSVSKGGVGGTGGRGGTSSGNSSANGGNAGSGGKGGVASGSSSGSAGDGGSAGNGGTASGNSSANGGSGGLGGSGVGAGSGSLNIGYSYTPPKEFNRIQSHVERIPGHPSLPLPESGGLLSDELYTHEFTNKQNKLIPTVSSTVASKTETGYRYPRPSQQFTSNQYQSGNTGTSQSGIRNEDSSQQNRPQAGYVPNPTISSQQNRPQAGYVTNPTISSIKNPSTPQAGLRPGHSQTGNRGGSSGEYFPGSTSQPLGLSPPVYQQQNFGDRFQTGNTYPPTPPSYNVRPSNLQIPAGGYVPPIDSSESIERDQNTLGNDSGEQSQPQFGSTGCGQGFNSCNNQNQPPQEIDYASIPGAITSNIPVIFYPDCRSNAYTRPAIVPFCPSLQQSTSSSSCSHNNPLTMKFPNGGNPYNNVPSSRGAYPSNFGNVFSTPQPRPTKRVVRRSRFHQHNRFI